MEYLPLLLQQDTNKLYPDIINCAIKAPPHWNGKVVHTFFLEKRLWLWSVIDIKTNFYKWGTQIQCEDPVILDAIEFNSKWYYILKYKEWQSIKVSFAVHNWEKLLSLLEDQFIEGINYKFKITEWVTWNVLQEWTGSGTVEGTIAYFNSTSGSFNSTYSGKYIYFYDGQGSSHSWVGQSWMLGWVAWSKVEVSTGWLLKPENVKYKVFSDYWQVLSFLFTRGIYHMHNESNILPALRLGEAVDFEYTKSTLFAVTKTYHINRSYAWYFSNLSDSRTAIGIAPGVFKLNAFKSYIIWLSKDRLYAIEPSESTDVIGGKTVRNTEYKLIPLSSSVWLLNAKAISDYNNGLYFITSDKKIVSFGLKTSWGQGYEVSIEDMWTNIQHRLDTIGENDWLGLAINQNEIQITHKAYKWQSFIYIYDQYYKFWHYWTSDLYISWIVPWITFKYFGDSVFTKTKKKLDDGVEYLQSIRVIAWEEDIFSLKNYVTHKIYLWQDTDINTLVRYNCNLWVQNYIFVQELNGTSYLEAADRYNFDGLLWSGIIGYNLLWGNDNKSKVKSILVANTGIIEIPVNLTCSIMSVTIAWDFQFWGMLFWFHKLESHITPIDSVVWYKDLLD